MEEIEAIDTYEIKDKILKSLDYDCREDLRIDNVRIDLYFPKKLLAVFIDNESDSYKRIKREDIEDIEQILRCTTYIISSCDTYEELEKHIDKIRKHLEITI